MGNKKLSPSAKEISQEPESKNIHHFVGASLYKKNSLPITYPSPAQFVLPDHHYQQHNALTAQTSVPAIIQYPCYVAVPSYLSSAGIISQESGNVHNLTDLQKRAIEVTGIPLINFNLNSAINPPSSRGLNVVDSGPPRTSDHNAKFVNPIESLGKNGGRSDQVSPSMCTCCTVCCNDGRLQTSDPLRTLSLPLDEGTLRYTNIHNDQLLVSQHQQMQLFQQLR